MFNVFTYPGSKVRLASRIVSLFPTTGHRYVDVFAGRGALVFEVLRRGGYRNLWINALGTIDFFEELRWLGPAPAVGPILFKSKNKEYYKRCRAETYKTTLEQLVNEFERRGATHISVGCGNASYSRGASSPAAKSYPMLDWLKRALDNEPQESLTRPASAATEAYNSYMGGTYASTGFKPQCGNGGISRQGMIRRFHEAGLMLEQHWSRIKLTALDYRDVLAQCTSADLVYL